MVIHSCGRGQLNDGQITIKCGCLCIRGVYDDRGDIDVLFMTIGLVKMMLTKPYLSVKSEQDKGKELFLFKCLAVLALEH